MPSVLLSACGSAAAEYCNGAREGEVMRAILELTEDYLHVSGMGASLLLPRTRASMPFGAVAAAARQRKSALVLMVCSGNYPANSGRRGVEICTPMQNNGTCGEASRRFAAILEEQFIAIAPGPVKQVPVPMPEFRAAKCPAAQVYVGSRSHLEDAQWMLQSTGAIAHALAKAAALWFDILCKSPFAHCAAVVTGGTLALRRAPGRGGELLRTLPNGTKLLLLHRDGDWQYVEHEGVCGYVMRSYLQAK